ncbi:hypothetical protein K7432_013422 [Basidiobolus ranarum]|uniref:Uncharacterized protein n=1 Tax=Basidiobolus ranarum TaxID=34480 RepID=A0ABR2WJ95_9FUNG
MGSRGIIINNDLFTLKARPWKSHETVLTRKTQEPIETFRVTYLVSKKKISKLAVVRNRVSRRLKQAAIKVMPEHAKSGFDYAFIPRLSVLDVEWNTLIEELKKSFRNSKLQGKSSPPPSMRNTYNGIRKEKRPVNNKPKGQ